MTQAIVNNLNNLNNGINAKELKPFVSNVSANSEGLKDTNFSSNFKNILDKTDTKQNYMVGSANRTNSNWDMSDDINKLNQILIKATQEANMENSLDLTLVKDINEIIDQLKSANISVEKYDAEIRDLQETVKRKLDNEDTDADAETSSVAVMFGQILKLLNCEDTTSSNIENSTTENTDSSLQDYKTILSKVTLKDDVKAENEDILKEQGIDQEKFDELNIESIGAETDNSNESSFTNRQSPEEFGIKLMLNNTDKSGMGFETRIHTSSAKVQSLNADRLFEQITKQMDSMNGSTKVNIVLNPESLGRLNIQIMNTKDGLTAQFTVTTNEARELLMKGLDGLKENLITHGIGVDNISVKIAESEESSYNPDWTEQENSENHSQEQHKQRREEKEKNLFEKTIEENLNLKNGSV